MKIQLRKHVSTLLLVFFLVGVRTTLANQYVVPTGSMIPTISIGDRIYANRVAYDLKVPFTHMVVKHLGDPARGEVVVFDSPAEAGLVLVKRLIAVPGDKVEILNGFVTVNGSRIDQGGRAGIFSYGETLGEHHYTVQRIPDIARAEKLAFVVPAGKYFMMGDNRDNSADGRYFGFVARELLIGRAERVLFSFDFSRHLAEAFDWKRIGKKL
ncbi:MAG: signal peptidase I [Bdellovibrionota bacterium]